MLQLFAVGMGDQKLSANQFYARNGSKLSHNLWRIFYTTYPNLTIFSKKVHMLTARSVVIFEDI